MNITYKDIQTVLQEKGELSVYINECNVVANTNNYAAKEASICLPADKGLYRQVLALVKRKKTTTLKYVIVVGIGGSNLGAKAIYDALYGNVDGLYPERYPKMFFLDTTDPEFLAGFSHFIKTHIANENEFVVSIISKSGGTTETIANAEILLGQLKPRFPNWKERCVIISDKNSRLWNEAANLGIDTLEVPKQVGGRYSVFSPVGLFPLALIGIDIESLLKGALDMRTRCLQDSMDNPALVSSLFLFHFLKQGLQIHDNFFFHVELESLGKWYRQLTGESIGKEKKGVTPMVSVGSVDHHSMVQLYWGGPRDKTVELIYTKKSAEISVPQEPLFPSLNTVAGRSTGEILSAIQRATTITYEKQNIPLFETILEEINAFELGSYMQYKMMEIMYLAHLMGINAFDQPEVELYKIETKKILGGK